MTTTSGWVDLTELEQRAQELLDPGVYGYFAGGADDELTLAANLAAWGRLRLRPHVLRDVSAVSTATTLLGEPVPTPFLVAPMGYHRLAHPDGELATAAGAAAAGVPLVASTVATTTLEDTAAAVPAAQRWFQLYVYRDRGYAAELVHRAAAAGYRALVLTADLATYGRRLREIRDQFKLPPWLEIANAAGRFTYDPDDPASISNQFDPGLTPEVIGWLHELAGMPVVVKGVLRGDDAAACVDAGAIGVIVSNHGGRQLDTAVATAEALPEVVEAVGDRAEVYVDGGIRRGTDVLKALALGARAVLVGRPVIWGLATGGAEGVQAVLDGLRAELERAMALCGAASVADLTPDLVVR
ncbi:MAG TPA: alpha-hydroxy acid oxidase [Actinomycetota bacterium]